MDIPVLQAALRAEGADAWLIWDFRGSNPVLGLLLPGKRTTTRRAVLFIPAQGEATLLVHGLDANQFEAVAVNREQYLSWRDLHAWLANRLAGKRRVAMEYAPGCTLPVVSVVDAGAIELVRALGVEVVSSADLIQTCVARWPSDCVREHDRASALVGSIMDGAFDFIRTRVGKSALTEHDVLTHIMSRFEQEKLETDHPPIVGVNAHSGDPHFEVSATNPAPIRPGDWVLIDMWARVPGDENVYSDITWCGYVGSKVPTQHREVFEVVRAARDASLHAAHQAWKDNRPIQGWQLDDAAKSVILEAGFERGLKHRTGHSLSPGAKVHGVGMNLDNLETHDTRRMIPEIGFTIEPGIYLPEFGVRLEIDVFVDPKSGPRVTSTLQRDVVLLA